LLLLLLLFVALFLLLVTYDCCCLIRSRLRLPLPFGCCWLRFGSVVRLVPVALLFCVVVAVTLHVALLLYVWDLLIYVVVDLLLLFVGFHRSVGCIGFIGLRFCLVIGLVYCLV